MTFFGQSSPPSSNAFFTTKPAYVHFVQDIYTIWTFSYAAPATPEKRQVPVVEGLDAVQIGVERMSLRNETAWIREVQALTDGTSVEQGLLIQKMGSWR